MIDYIQLIENYSSIKMHGNPINTNILRNSYGYQIAEPPQLRSPNHKGFQPNGFPQSESITSSIRQMENKIEGVETMVKKKYSQMDPPLSQPNLTKYQSFDNRFKQQFPVNHPQQPIPEHLLRGSCQNLIRKFDYNNLRNTTHFNHMNKFTTHNQIRRSPGAEDPNYRLANNNRTMAQEPINTFLRPNQRKILENKHSLLAANQAKTPPKNNLEKRNEDKTIVSSRTPIKYKNHFQNPVKASTTLRNSPEQEQKRLFKSLNQIVQTKTREKVIPDALKGKKSKIINGFQFGQVLGKGKFGQVFLARHHQTGFIAAIKKIQKQKVRQFKMTDQFVKEIKLHSCLDHPNIVRFFGVFQQQQSVYLVMQYLNGGTLFDYLNEVNCLGIKQTVQFLKDIIEALTYMHDKSIAHRDIKPQNIVISSEGVAKLCDFGWSALVQTSRKTYCGTFDYAPPQILQRKNYDSSVDIWCLGVLTYQLLTGHVPFQGEKRNVIMDKILNVDKNKIDYPVDIPIEAKEFIECLVQKDPAHRPKCHDLLKFKLFTTYLQKGQKPKKNQ